MGGGLVGPGSSEKSGSRLGWAVPRSAGSFTVKEGFGEGGEGTRWLKASQPLP